VQRGPLAVRGALAASAASATLAGLPDGTRHLDIRWKA